MSKKSRAFDAGFKLEVARMVKDQGMSVSQVCRERKVGATAVRRWVQQYGTEHSGSAGTAKSLTTERKRIRELEQQVRELKMDNDILKKATAFFARELK